jgi:putative addiction module component (TIGR02574 family)
MRQSDYDTLRRRVNDRLPVRATYIETVSWCLFMLERAPAYENLGNMSAITKLKGLSVPERLQLVEDLWDSIAADQTALPDHPQVIEEVRRRQARFAQNPSTGLSWDVLKRKIRSGHG